MLLDYLSQPLRSDIDVLGQVSVMDWLDFANGKGSPFFAKVVGGRRSTERNPLTTITARDAMFRAVPFPMELVINEISHSDDVTAVGHQDGGEPVESQAVP